jgi:hypothetical protein
MNRKGFTPIIIAIIIVVVLITGGAYWYLNKPTQKRITQNNPTTSTEQSIVSSSIAIVTTTPASASVPVLTQQEITSSSSLQVGDYLVVANCGNLGEDDIASVKEIDIFKNDILVQSIPTKGIAPGSHNCPKPQSQDINFDGYQDFMIDGDYGTGGTSVYYWLYNTTTQQFYCPGGSFFYCSLMNPSFNNASKTISEWDSLSVGETVSWIDTVDGDSINLYQKTDEIYTGTSTLITVSQMENGKLVVVSTSSRLSSD